MGQVNAIYTPPPQFGEQTEAGEQVFKYHVPDGKPCGAMIKINGASNRTIEYLETQTWYFMNDENKLDYDWLRARGLSCDRLLVDFLDGIPGPKQVPLAMVFKAEMIKAFRVQPPKKKSTAA